MEAVSLAAGAAGGVSPLVRDLGLCLVAAGLLSVAFVRLKIPAIAALLVAGVVLGPAGLEAIGDRGNVDTIASLGLTLLLFVIGLESAEVIVSTVPDELLKGVTNEVIVQRVRALAPDATIIANATQLSQTPALVAAGADHVFRAPTEVAIGVLPAIHAALNGELKSFLESWTQQHGRPEERAEVID